MRTVQAVAFAFVVALALLTVVAMVISGPDVLTVLSLLVLALIGFGVLGALRG
jgi:hypothetical protein